MTVTEVLPRIAESLDVDPNEIGMDTIFQDVRGWDSISTMSLVLLLYKEFDLKLGPHETSMLTSVPDVIQLLRDAGKIE